MDITHILLVASSVLGIFLLLLSYTYIDKLEKIGCPCAESKYRKFLKNFSLFAALYLFALMFVSPSALPTILGINGTIIFKVFNVAMFLLFFASFVIALMYTRNLINEKCQCSEDIRREVLYVYSIVEIVLLSLNVVIGILLALFTGAVAVAMATVNNVSNNEGTLIDNVTNPIGNVAKLPKSLKNVTSSLKKTFKRSAK